jgi:hypothetical protein
MDWRKSGTRLGRVANPLEIVGNGLRLAGICDKETALFPTFGTQGVYEFLALHTPSTS